MFGTIVLRRTARVGLRKGQAFALYVAMYTFGRIFFECDAHRPACDAIFGVRFNLLLSIVLCVFGIVVVRVARPATARRVDRSHDVAGTPADARLGRSADAS